MDKNTPKRTNGRQRVPAVPPAPPPPDPSTNPYAEREQSSPFVSVVREYDEELEPGRSYDTVFELSDEEAEEERPPSWWSTQHPFVKFILVIMPFVAGVYFAFVGYVLVNATGQSLNLPTVTPRGQTNGVPSIAATNTALAINVKSPLPATELAQIQATATSNPNLPTVTPLATPTPTLLPTPLPATITSGPTPTLLPTATPVQTTTRPTTAATTNPATTAPITTAPVATTIPIQTSITIPIATTPPAQTTAPPAQTTVLPLTTTLAASPSVTTTIPIQTAPR